MNKAHGWQSIKKTDDIKLVGVDVETEWRDGSLAAVTLDDGYGGMLRLVLDNFRMCVLVPAQHKTKKAHVVKADVPATDLKVREEFDDEYGAGVRERQLREAGMEPTVVVEDVDIPF